MEEGLGVLKRGGVLGAWLRAFGAGSNGGYLLAGTRRGRACLRRRVWGFERAFARPIGALTCPAVSPLRSGPLLVGISVRGRRSATGSAEQGEQQASHAPERSPAGPILAVNSANYGFGRRLGRRG